MFWNIEICICKNFSLISIRFRPFWIYWYTYQKIIKKKNIFFLLNFRQKIDFSEQGVWGSEILAVLLGVFWRLLYLYCLYVPDLILLLIMEKIFVHHLLILLRNIFIVFYTMNVQSKFLWFNLSSQFSINIINFITLRLFY